MPYNLTDFTQWIFVADFLQAKCDFRRKTAVCVFEFLLGGLGATYNDHQAHWNGRCGFTLLLVLIELFSLCVTAEALRANVGSKSAISLQRGPVDPKFPAEGVALPTICLLRKLGYMIFRMVYLTIWTDLSFRFVTIHAFDGRTDRRTDGQNSHR